VFVPDRFTCVRRIRLKLLRSYSGQQQTDPPETAFDRVSSHGKWQTALSGYLQEHRNANFRRESRAHFADPDRTDGLESFNPVDA
jgi:hypothetical protein